MPEEAAVYAVSSHPEGPFPFDDPVQRTKCLVQYIRLRKQRAEDELAKRNALKKQKKDAKATLQNARDGLRTSESEIKRCEQRLEELTQSRHDLLITLKQIINRETDRKRQREVEETRRLEEQQRLQQTLQLDAIMQQFKNAQTNPLMNPILSALAGGLAQASHRSSPHLQASNPSPSPSSRYTPYPIQEARQQQQLVNARFDAQQALQQQQQQQQVQAAYLRQYASQMAALNVAAALPAVPQMETSAPGANSSGGTSNAGGLTAEVYAALLANYKAAAAASLNSGSH